VLWFNPCLPETIETLRMHIHYRGKLLTLEISTDILTIHVDDTTPEPIQIGFKNEIHELRHGQTIEIELAARGQLHREP